MSLADQIFNAGVVGAGGAGFPTHIKANSKVETMIANGAECEPLIHKDVELMKNFPAEIIKGMELMNEAVGARKSYFGIKSKNTQAIEAIENQLDDSIIEMTFLGDFYPAGDEYELVHHATGKLIPPHGIPLDIGCVVNNVETLYNVYNASKGIPVTEKFVTLTGLVKNPSSFFVPVGTSFRDLIELAGGSTISEFGIFVSGLMMGKLTFDLEEVVTKNIGGLILLPKDHYLIDRQTRTNEDMNRIGKSACDQCSYCTEFCPRYLLGYDVQPHKVMRSLEFSKTGSDYWNKYADLCCSCGICSLYACPEDLYPREACIQSKTVMKNDGFKYEQHKPVKVHPIKDGRKIPLKQLRKKLNVQNYEFPTPFKEIDFNPKQVKIMLSQHVGAPADPKISIGKYVEKGEMIGGIPEGKLGAPIHASISGTVSEITDKYIKIESR